MNKKEKLKFVGRFVGGGLLWIIAIMAFVVVAALALYGFFWVAAAIISFIFPVDVQALMSVTIWSVLFGMMFIMGGLWATQNY